jgi:hypothetical protein
MANGRADETLANPVDSLEVFHQDLSSVLPTTVVSCRIDPTGSEKICTDGLAARRPDGIDFSGREAAGHPETPTACAPLEDPRG